MKGVGLKFRVSGLTRNQNPETRNFLLFLKLIIKVMRAMKYYTVIFLLSLFCNLFAQDNDPDLLELPNEDEVIVLENDSKNNKKKVRYDINAGMNFSMLSNRYCAPGYYLNPQLNYDASKKMTLYAGTGFSYMKLYPMNTSGNNNSPMPLFSNYVYVGGNYKFSERLTVNAEVEYATYTSPKSSRIDEYANFQRNMKSYMVGVHYKITPSLSVNFEMNYSDNPRLMCCC